ncbi:carboxypeptidase-like regulatory domain-containing protein [Bacteroides sp. 51]|uniref:carboxypeptidase-like regulatory domain-containing protein n=1 Tax=Bacteroides sp. 51 TaxID=2302938 RepID=UPI001EF2128E|nr:carboxypeptidase-like regulatory domain-containing protein [Bacteroides sp. 51]
MKHRISSSFCFWLLFILGLFYSQLDYAQTRSTVSVKGRIVDSANMEIVGAVVKIKDRPVGTTTDVDGNFTINAQVGDVLEFSYLGYRPQTIKVAASQKPLTIQLEDDSILLDNVVVIGYGTNSKEKLTGSVSTVSTSDFKNRPITDVSMALQGKVTGL